MNMKASIIIPAYNAEKTIEECLQSLITQNLGQDFEIIVVDDGSSDATIKIVRNFIRKNKKIKLIEQNHSGPAKARNLGAKNASWEILLFIDSDCVAEENWLREMLKPFAEASVAGVQGAYKTKQENLIARFVQLEIENRYERMRHFASIDWIGSYSAAYRKNIFLKNKGFDTEFKIASGEDPELSYRIAEKGHKLVFNPNAIIFHKHVESFLAYLKKKFWHSYWRTSLYSKHSKKMVKDSYTPQTLKAQLAVLALIFLSGVFGLITCYVLLQQIALAFIVLLILLIFPTTFFMLKRDFSVGIIALPLLIARDIVMVVGLTLGVLTGKWRK